MFESLTYTSWLFTKVYQNHYFFFDLWSLVHLWSGFVLIALFTLIKVQKLLAKLFIVLLLYEVVEILILYFVSGIIKPEIFKDQFTDIIIGMIGGGIGLIILNYTFVSNPRHVFRLKLFTIFLTSITYSFLWVGFYGYHYNMEFFNSPGINWLAWAGWAAGIFGVVFCFEFFKIKNLLLRFSVVWVSHLAVLFIIETLAYYFFSIHEVSIPGAPPLIFGIIHGSPLLHFMYVFSPFFTITLYFGFKYLIFKALITRKKSYKTSGIFI